MKFLAVNIFFFRDQNRERSGVVEKGTISSAEASLPINPHAWQETQVDLSQLVQSLATT